MHAYEVPARLRLTLRNESSDPLVVVRFDAVVVIRCWITYYGQGCRSAGAQVRLCECLKIDGAERVPVDDEEVFAVEKGERAPWSAG